jgi:hypothetical protein
MSLIDIFRAKKPPTLKAVRAAIVEAPKKPMLVQKREDLVAEQKRLSEGRRDRSLKASELRRRADRLDAEIRDIEALEGVCDRSLADIDAHEAGKLKVIDDLLNGELEILDRPDISTAIADAPEEMREAAE